MQRNELFKNLDLNFFKKNAPQKEVIYTGFGVFCIISTICTMYNMSVVPDLNKLKSLLYIYESMLVISVCIITYPLWPTILKKDTVIHILWYAGILYLLIICSTFFVMLSNLGSLEVIVFTVNLLVVVISTRWKVSLAMIVIGLTLGAQFYQLYTGGSVENIGVKIGSFPLILYILLLFGTAIVILLKPNQEEQELIEQKVTHLGDRITDRERSLMKALATRAEFINNITHEFHAPMTGITSMAETLYQSYEKLNDTQRKNAAKVIFESSCKLESYYNNIINLAQLSSSLEEKLAIVPVYLSKLVYERIDFCRKIYSNDTKQVFILKIQEEVSINCDLYYIGQTIDNLIINAINYCKEGKILISLKKIDDFIEFIISDEGVGIPINELYDIFEPFTVSSKTKVSSGGRGVGLALCKRIIELHGGSINAISDGKKGAIFKFILPKIY